MLKYKLEKQWERINILKSKTNKYRLIINMTNPIHSITIISSFSMYIGSYCVCCTFYEDIKVVNQYEMEKLERMNIEIYGIIWG